MTDGIQHRYARNAIIPFEQVQTLSKQAAEDPEHFWGEQANRLIDFIKPFSKVHSGGMASARWFEDGSLNVCYQCVDRHLPTKGEQTAILWQGDEPLQQQTFTYYQLHQQICRMANILKKYGVTKGDRVCIYLPMIPETAFAMLACARIGAIHSVVFAGFSPQALAQRINDADCKLLITTDVSHRGGKAIPLGNNVVQAIQQCPSLNHTLLIDGANEYKDQIEHVIDWQSETSLEECPCEEMAAEDPLFILYTSGSTGKPKGVLHTSAGYIVYAAFTHQLVFDYQPGDIYWCAADVGWVTGHSYIIYGPLANGATTLMFAGTPTYPTPARYWEIIDNYQVNIFYTAPTALRALMKEGNQWLTTTKRSSLRVLGSVGEPINPEVWQWYYQQVGGEQASIVDTWWQTETGGIMITPVPDQPLFQPGKAQQPLPGISLKILHPDSNGHGTLAITKPWPGMTRTLYGDHQRYLDTYFKNGFYIPGDEASIDTQGNYQILGRMDDVMNVSGHRLGTAEIESAILLHPTVAESAVVSQAHPIKGESVFAYVTLKQGNTATDALKEEIRQTVREAIGAIASPDIIEWSEELPKTRSGKIMRRILRKIANHQYDSLGDLSTLAQPNVVEKLIEKAQNH